MSEVIGHCRRIRAESIAKLHEIELLLVMAPCVVAVRRHRHLVVDQRLERPAFCHYAKRIFSKGSFQLAAS
jgi:hypothetical protein